MTAIIVFVSLNMFALMTGSIAATCVAADSKPSETNRAPLLVTLARPRQRARTTLSFFLCLGLGSFVVAILGAAAAFAAEPDSFCYDAEMRWDADPTNCEEASFGLALYWSICALGTVGLGEVIPSQTAAGRTVTTLYILLCIPTYPIIIGVFTGALIDRHKRDRAAPEAGMEMRDLTVVP